MKRVTIAVCTYRRESLAETLASLAALDLTGIEARIVVIDNDAEPSARAVVEACSTTAPLPVGYVHVPGQNISIARNAALEAAGTGFLASIDDDERAAPRWLAALLAEQARSGAAVVFGPVVAEYGPDAPDWMRRAEPHATRPVYVDGEIRTGSTGNALVDLDHPALTALRFDISLGRTGGEDTVYFGTAHARGAPISFAAEAVVLEKVAEDRLAFGWLARRKFRMGTTHARVLLEVEGRPRVRAFAVALAKTGYCALAALAALPIAELRNKSVLRGLFHAGVVAALARSRETSTLAGAVGG